MSALVVRASMKHCTMLAILSPFSLIILPLLGDLNLHSLRNRACHDEECLKYAMIRPPSIR